VLKIKIFIFKIQIINKLEIKNSENEYIKIYTMKIDIINGKSKTPYIEGNIVILNKKIFKI
jgi:hypothetical protein